MCHCRLPVVSKSDTHQTSTGELGLKSKSKSWCGSKTQKTANVLVPVEFLNKSVFPLVKTNSQLKKEQWAGNGSVIKDRHVLKLR